MKKDLMYDRDENDRGRLGPLVLNAPKSIPECADDEMSLVRDYYYNWHLRETIENMFTDSLPAKEELITVVKLASEMTNKDARCKLLINSSQCMLDIHECANAPAEEWVPKIQFALNKSEEYGKQLHERIISEVERLRAKLEDNWLNIWLVMLINNSQRNIVHITLYLI